jgi:hypothetical protein
MTPPNQALVSRTTAGAHGESRASADAGGTGRGGTGLAELGAGVVPDAKIAIDSVAAWHDC